MFTPLEIANSLDKFRKQYPEPQRVGFVMMRFSTTQAYNNILEAVRKVFKENGITLLRADDFQFHSDLFLNILTYMHGCGIGVAIFERIESNDFNPNVSLEVGYMMALGKPVCYLKDKTLKALPTDIIGKLYISFDSYDPEKGLKSEIEKWLAANDLCLRCFLCSIEVELDINDWKTSNLDDIIAGFELFIRVGNKPRFKGIRPSKFGGIAKAAMHA